MQRLFIISLTLIIFILSENLLAQDEPLIRISDVTIENPLWLPDAKWDEFINASYDHTKNELFVLFKSQLFRLDVAQSMWEEYANIDLPEDVRQFDYSPYHHGFLFWDRGVGRVFLLDSLKQMKRIDNSFNHKNQFGHSPWIDHRTGELFAFGGYGLFTIKSIITRFNSASGEWEEQPVLSPNTIPAPQTNASIIPDFPNGRIYMVGLQHYATEVIPNNRHMNNDRAIWEFNLMTNTWTQLSTLVSKVKITPNMTSWLSNTYLSLNPRLNLFLLVSNDDIQRDFIEAYHIPSNKVKNLIELDPNLKTTHPILYIAWSETDQVFYVLAANIMDSQRAIHVGLKKIEILNEDDFITWMSESERDYSLMISGILIITVIFGLFRIRKTRNGTSTNVENSDSNEKICIKCTGDGSFLSVSYGDKYISEIPVMEQKLLELLMRNMDLPNKFTASDDVDMHLLPDHPSTDYIRRNRNLTLERLEALFQSLNTLENNKYIIRSVNQFDKRKSEYRLNDEYIKVEL